MGGSCFHSLSFLGLRGVQIRLEDETQKVLTLAGSSAVISTSPSSPGSKDGLGGRILILGRCACSPSAAGSSCDGRSSGNVAAFSAADFSVATAAVGPSAAAGSLSLCSRSHLAAVDAM